MDLRIRRTQLAVPGVIGVRSPSNGYHDRVRLVDLGRDAGFPAAQRLADWKHDQTLVDVRAVDDGVATALNLTLPVRELHSLSVATGDEQEWCPAIGDEERLDAVRLAARWPWIAVAPAVRPMLDDLGVPYWVAGHTRHTNSAWVQRADRGTKTATEVFRWVVDRPLEPRGALPDGCDPDRASILWEATWADRVLRALTDGAITEPGLQFAQWQVINHGLYGEELVTDDVARAGAAVARMMCSGEHHRVDLPLHGPAVAIRLPGVAVPIRRLPGGVLWTDGAHAGEADELVLPSTIVWMLADGPLAGGGRATGHGR